MNNRISGADADEGNERVKLRLLLTDTETELLDRAVEESGAWSRSLLITEAIRAGVANPKRELEDGRRKNRIDALVP